MLSEINRYSLGHILVTRTLSEIQARKKQAGKSRNLLFYLLFLVGDTRFELVTSAMSRQRSNQLS